MADDTEDDLPPEDVPVSSGKKDPLKSPGAATSQRIMLEMQLVQVAYQAFHGFLSKTQKDAVVSLAASMTADPFTLGGVLGNWAEVSDKFVATIADKLSMEPNSGYLTAVERRLKFMRLPTDAYNSAHAVLQAATAEGWSETQTARSLAKVLDSTQGTVFEGMEKDMATLSGMNWDAEAYKIARTEATAAYGESVNNALAADPQAYTKMWVAFNDAVTRPSHAEADGQVVAIDDVFIVGGEALQYPGDPAGSPSEIDNCRCVIVDGAGNEVSGDETPPPPVVPNPDDSIDTGGDLAGMAESALASDFPLGDLFGNLGGDIELLDGESLGVSGALTGDILSGTNPLYGLDAQAGINCQKCTAAYELRQRGYDVVAGVGNPGSQHSTGLYTWFKDAKINVDRDLVPVTDAVTGAERFSVARDAILDRYPPASRGSLSVHWNLGGSHVFNWERVGGREGIDVKFVDAQSGKIYTRGDGMWDRIAGDRSLTIQRLDNREFLPAGSSALRSGKEFTARMTETTKVKLSELNSELARNEKLLAETRRTNVISESHYDYLRGKQNGALTHEQSVEYNKLRVMLREDESNYAMTVAAIQRDIRILDPAPAALAKQSALQKAIFKSVTERMPALEDRFSVALKAQEKAYRAWTVARNTSDDAVAALRQSEYLAAKTAREAALNDLNAAKQILRDAESPGSLALSEVKTIPVEPVTSLDQLFSMDSMAIKSYLNEDLSFADKQSGLTAQVSRVSVKEDGGLISWTVNITGPNGEVAGVASRTLVRDATTGDLRVVHTYFELLQPDMQGSGFATRWNQQAEKWYADHGIKEISLNANIDVGGYAWARAGYDWAKPFDSLSVMDRVLKAIPRDDPLYASTKAMVDKASAAALTGYHLGDIPTPYELSRVGYTPGATTWAGKEGMLGSSWDGVKDLTAVEEAAAGLPAVESGLSTYERLAAEDGTFKGPKFGGFTKAENYLKGLVLDSEAQVDAVTTKALGSPVGYSILKNQYSGELWSFDVNRALREGGGSLSSQDAKKVALLHDEVRAFAAPDNVTVYRGIMHVDDAFGAADLTGSQITDAAFQSTSAAREYATRWVSYKNDSAVMEIIIPKGTPIGVVGGREYEILIPDGATLRIVSDTMETVSRGGAAKNDAPIRVIRAYVEKVAA
jgi:hypothetical protein